MTQYTRSTTERACLLAAAAVLRLGLCVIFPELPNLLTSRVEISTPVTSFKRCKSAFLFAYMALKMRI